MPKGRSCLQGFLSDLPFASGPLLAARGDVRDSDLAGLVVPHMQKNVQEILLVPEATHSG